MASNNLEQFSAHSENTFCNLTNESLLLKYAKGYQAIESKSLNTAIMYLGDFINESLWYNALNNTAIKSIAKPHTISTLNLLGLCYYTKGDFQKSLYYWKKSTEESSDSLNPAFGYLEHLESNEFKDFMVAYNQSIDLLHEKELIKALLLLEPYYTRFDFIELNNLIGLIFLKLGLKNLARERWRRTLSVNLEDIDATYYLANTDKSFCPLFIEKLVLGVHIIARR